MASAMELRHWTRSATGPSCSSVFWEKYVAPSVSLVRSVPVDFRPRWAGRFSPMISSGGSRFRSFFGRLLKSTSLAAMTKDRRSYDTSDRNSHVFVQGLFQTPWATGIRYALISFPICGIFIRNDANIKRVKHATKSHDRNVLRRRLSFVHAGNPDARSFGS